MKRLYVIGIVLVSLDAGAQPTAEPPPEPPPAPDPAPPPEPPPPPDLTPAPVVVPVEVAPPPAPVESQFSVPKVQIHGFASEGGFVSTANDYIGHSSRGSLDFFEAGINFSTEVADRLRVGIQLYGRDMGTLHDPPGIDWAYLDYHWKPWLGLRAGIIKMPYGLYNEYTDVDSSRVAILMPQSVYPIHDRDVLLAQTGFALYGDRSIGTGGELEYQAWLGTLEVPADALEVSGATLDNTDTKYVTGAQVFWHPPLDGLKVGATYLRASFDINLTLSPASVAALAAAGLVAPDFDGKLTLSQRPDQLIIGSAEYLRGDWQFAAEYSRWLGHDESTLPNLIPVADSDSEKFYVLAALRFNRYLQAGSYYSIYNVDANDRHGSDVTKFPERFEAFQRDLAATLRFDVNDHWLWKVEAHYMDGTADLDATLPVNQKPERYWGMFLFKTTVTF